MARFQFRLQKVLDHRERTEEAAKLALMEGRAARIRAEQELATHLQRQHDLLNQDGDLRFRLSLDALQVRMDDESLQHQTVIDLLTQEEEGLMDVWRTEHQNAEAMRKLKEAALNEWQLDESRKEQAALDEWATQRRTA